MVVLLVCCISASWRVAVSSKSSILRHIDWIFCFRSAMAAARVSFISEATDLRAPRLTGWSISKPALIYVAGQSLIYVRGAEAGGVRAFWHGLRVRLGLSFLCPKKLQDTVTRLRSVIPGGSGTSSCRLIARLQWERAKSLSGHHRPAPSHAPPLT